MHEIKKVSIIGLGAIGCTVAPFLQKILGYKNVRVIAEGKRKEKIEQKGITVNGMHYNFLVTSPDQEVEAADLMIVAVKYGQLSSAINDIHKHVGENTKILSLMNGIDSRDKLGGEYGIEKLLYGLTTISAINEGNCCFSFADNGIGIKFGEDQNIEPFSETVCAVKKLFDVSGITYTVPENMIRELWVKFLLNVGGNCTNTLLRGTHSYFQKISSANAARRMLMEEVLEVSKAMGTGLVQEDVEEMMGIYSIYPAENKCSMLQDLEAGRKMENDMLCGYVVELGEKCGVPTPVNQYVYYVLDALDKVNEGILGI